MRNVQSGRVRTSLKRVLTHTFVAMAILATLLAGSVWLIAHRQVEAFHSVSAKAGPVPPLLASAILAAEDPYFLSRPRLSLRFLLPPYERTLACGPSPVAVTLVRAMTVPYRAWRWNLSTAVGTYAVAEVFTPEELLKIYAHEVYLGTVEGEAVIGVETASKLYFGKRAADLSAAEAATIAAMIQSPNAYSPIRHPDRAIERRNRVLMRMTELHFINQEQLQRSIREPLPPYNRWTDGNTR